MATNPNLLSAAREILHQIDSRKIDAPGCADLLVAIDRKAVEYLRAMLDRAAATKPDLSGAPEGRSLTVKCPRCRGLGNIYRNDLHPSELPT